MDKVVRINDLEVVGVRDRDYLEYFAPHVILPEKTAEFFLLSRNYLPSLDEALLMPWLSGEFEKLKKVEQDLEELAMKADYGFKRLFGDFFRKIIYPHIRSIVEQTSMMLVSGMRTEDVQIEIARLLFENVPKQPEVIMTSAQAAVIPQVLHAFFRRSSLEIYFKRNKKVA
ncbi:MAG: hypothetical protein QXS85_06225 [Acidilobaceae archaeon]